MGPQTAPRAAFAALLLVVALSPATGFTLGATLAQLRGSAARQSAHWTAPLPLLARGVPRRDVPRLTAAKREGAGATVMQDAAATTNNRPTALASPAFGDTGGAILLVEVRALPRSMCCASRLLSACVARSCAGCSFRASEPTPHLRPIPEGPCCGRGQAADALRPNWGVLLR